MIPKLFSRSSSRSCHTWALSFLNHDVLFFFQKCLSYPSLLCGEVDIPCTKCSRKMCSRCSDALNDVKICWICSGFCDNISDFGDKYFVEQTKVGDQREQQLRTIVKSEWRDPEVFTIRFICNDKDALAHNLVKILFMRGSSRQFEGEMEVHLKVKFFLTQSNTVLYSCD